MKNTSKVEQSSIRVTSHQKHFNYWHEFDLRMIHLVFLFFEKSNILFCCDMSLLAKSSLGSISIKIWKWLIYGIGSENMHKVFFTYQKVFMDEREYFLLRRSKVKGANPARLLYSSKYNKLRYFLEYLNSI